MKQKSRYEGGIMQKPPDNLKILLCLIWKAVVSDRVKKRERSTLMQSRRSRDLVQIRSHDLLSDG